MEYLDSEVDAALLQYVEREDLLKYFNTEERENIDKEVSYTSAEFGVRAKVAFPPDLEDLVFLHQTVRNRKCFTVLEFGLGFSTFIMADALLKNKLDFEALSKKPHIRCQTKFELHTVDAESSWITLCQERLSKCPELADIITFHFSGVTATTFNDRICHLYDKLPNIVPDFIYLDAPGTDSVKSSVHGMEFEQCSDRTVMSADICLMEPILLPGCYIVVDGRTNNARFIRNNLQRSWTYQFNQKRDISIFELKEEPLGMLNKNMLVYCGLI